MRQLIYKVSSENTYTYFFTYAEAQKFKAKGYKVETVLLPIPTEYYHDDLLPWVTVNGKLVRQYA